MNRRQVNHLVAFFELSIDKKTLNPINKLNAFNYGVYMSASEFKEINKEDRHFLLTCSFPHNGESHFRNFHYVRKNGASLPPLREIRHSLRTFLQPNPRTLDIISLCEIDSSEASIFFEGMQEPLPF